MGENFDSEVLVENSKSGRETVMCFGTWSGAQVEIQTQIEIDDELSPVTTFPENGIYTDNFSIEVNVGSTQPLIVTVTNAGSADLLKYFNYLFTSSNNDSLEMDEQFTGNMKVWIA